MAARHSDGTVLLCLHEWGAHEHPSLTSPHYAKPGNGLLLFFRVDNFDMALPRARALVSRIGGGAGVEPAIGRIPSNCDLHESQGGSRAWPGLKRSNGLAVGLFDPDRHGVRAD